jgi:hypothetical protein
LAAAVAAEHVVDVGDPQIARQGKIPMRGF